MDELYLVAHKVRGEPAFDVATRIQCSECEGNSNKGREPYICFACDDLGYWWIIPTSGHRAYVYWSIPLKIEDLEEGLRLIMDHNPKLLTWTIFPMPESLRDHYPTVASPRKLSLSLADLGL